MLATVTQGSVGALRFITELSAAGGRWLRGQSLAAARPNSSLVDGPVCRQMPKRRVQGVPVRGGVWRWGAGGGWVSDLGTAIRHGGAAAPEAKGRRCHETGLWGGRGGTA